MTALLHSVLDAEDGLRLEAELLASDRPCIGFWAAQRPAIVCPRAFERKPGFDAASSAALAHGWPVYLRPTGGGAVPQSAGVANMALSFDAPGGFTIEDGYRVLVKVIIKALGKQGSFLSPGETPGSFCDGAWNLSAFGKKIVGTAQRWRPVPGGKPRVLAHAMFLTDDRYQPGASAVAAFHKDLGLEAIDTDAHTSLRTSLGMAALPVAALHSAAQAALAHLHIIDSPDRHKGRKSCPTKPSTSILKWSFPKQTAQGSPN